MCRKPRDATFPSRRESAVNPNATSPPSHPHLTAMKELVVKRGIKLDYDDLPLRAAGGDK